MISILMELLAAINCRTKVESFYKDKSSSTQRHQLLTVIECRANEERLDKERSLQILEYKGEGKGLRG